MRTIAELPLKKADGFSITLEPGAQLELSGALLDNPPRNVQRGQYTTWPKCGPWPTGAGRPEVILRHEVSSPPPWREDIDLMPKGALRDHAQLHAESLAQWVMT